MGCIRFNVHNNPKLARSRSIMYRNAKRRVFMNAKKKGGILGTDAYKC